MTPAPAFDCALCQRRIGKTAHHIALDDGRVICLRCTGKPAHARLYPGCPKAWHDIYDHPSVGGTRAGIAAHLGLWP